MLVPLYCGNLISNGVMVLGGGGPLGQWLDHEVKALQVHTVAGPEIEYLIPCSGYCYVLLRSHLQSCSRESRAVNSLQPSVLQVAESHELPVTPRRQPTSRSSESRKAGIFPSDVGFWQTADSRALATLAKDLWGLLLDSTSFPAPSLHKGSLISVLYLKL